jgi:hypothetical protein
LRTIQNIVLVQIAGIWHNAGVPDERTPRGDPQDLIARQQREITQLRNDLRGSHRRA